MALVDDVVEVGHREHDCNKQRQQCGTVQRLAIFSEWLLFLHGGLPPVDLDRRVHRQQCDDQRRRRDDVTRKSVAAGLAVLLAQHKRIAHQTERERTDGNRHQHQTDKRRAIPAISWPAQRNYSRGIIARRTEGQGNIRCSGHVVFR